MSNEITPEQEQVAEARHEAALAARVAEYPPLSDAQRETLECLAASMHQKSPEEAALVKRLQLQYLILSERSPHEGYAVLGKFPVVAGSGVSWTSAYGDQTGRTWLISLVDDDYETMPEDILSQLEAGIRVAADWLADRYVQVNVEPDGDRYRAFIWRLPGVEVRGDSREQAMEAATETLRSTLQGFVKATFSHLPEGWTAYYQPSLLDPSAEPWDECGIGERAAA